MMGHTHWVIGGMSWLGGLTALEIVTGYTPTPLVIAGGFAIASVSALLPDIDSKKSMASKMLGPITGAISWCVRTLFGGHRKITHSLLGLILIELVSFGSVHFFHLPYWIALAVTIGWASHILADMTTREGCPLMWPGNKHNYGLHLVTTGKDVEKYFIRPVSVGLCILFSALLVIGV